MSTELSSAAASGVFVLGGDLPVHRERVTPGHEVVGEVVDVGAGAGEEFSVGDRVGVAWLRHTCGACPYCLRGDENLCVAQIGTSQGNLLPFAAGKIETTVEATA